MEWYALIPYEGKIVMVAAADIVLDKERVVLEDVGKTASLQATVTPDNALVKGIIWTSSDEAVAKVDDKGLVTAVGKGEAVITATTVSPYQAKASCNVIVGEEADRTKRRFLLQNTIEQQCQNADQKMSTDS